jgi:L-2-hydroxyglutarate oxidase
MNNSETSNVLVVGGGIVGLATACCFLERFPGRTVRVLEKESALGQHQTGHNSGVLHSGIYYKPESLKAKLCREGKRLMEQFCDEEGVPYDTCGKVIVATDESEVPRLDSLMERGKANGVTCERIGPERLRELEPHCAGIQAIHVSETGIVDYGEVVKRLAKRICERGGSVVTGARVARLEETANDVIAHSSAGDFRAELAVNCAGLYSDRVARHSGQHVDARIVPFRGEYYELIDNARELCRNLIYPVPDPRFPFLGVHFTRMISGHVECGPNAVLAWAREGYTKTSIVPGELLESLTYPGFLRLAARFWPVGIGEMWRSVNKGAFVHALQRLVPEIRADRMVAAPAGVRAQAVGSNGATIDDFAFADGARSVHVLNAPSPAATASLSIGAVIVERLAGRM